MVADPSMSGSATMIYFSSEPITLTGSPEQAERIRADMIATDLNPISPVTSGSRRHRNASMKSQTSAAMSFLSVTALSKE